MKSIYGGLLGAAFGYWLNWVGFTDYDVILNALLLHDFYLWGIFVLGLALSGIGIRLLRIFGARTWVGGEKVAWESSRLERHHWVGSALFGAGWALTGACPGPAIAQAGSGHLAGLWTLTGILIGVALADLLEERRSTGSGPAERSAWVEGG